MDLGVRLDDCLSERHRPRVVLTPSLRQPRVVRTLARLGLATWISSACGVPPVAPVSSGTTAVVVSAPAAVSLADPPKLTARFRDLAFEGYVAYLQILAQEADGSDVAWGLTLARFTDGCLGDAAGPTILLDLDGKGRARPAGIVYPASFHFYPAGDPVPSHEETLTNASHIEISGGEPPTTEDGIGHGEKIGSVRFDVRLRDGLISGETVLVDCGR